MAAKTDAQRKADQRKREAAHLAKMGAEVLQLTLYKGTRAELDKLKSDHGFEDGPAGDGELITYLIHNAVKRDMSQQADLVSIPKRKTA